MPDGQPPKPYYPKSVNRALQREDPPPAPPAPPVRPARPAPYDHAQERPLRPRRRKFSRLTPLSALFFPLAVLYHELLLRAFDGEYTRFFAPALLRVLLFSLAAGTLVRLLLDLIPKKSLARFIGGALILLFTVYTCVERGVRSFFGMYYGLTTISSMGGEVAGNFKEETLSTVRDILPFIALALLPLPAYGLLRRRVLPGRNVSGRSRCLLAGLLIAGQLLGWGISAHGAARPSYTYDYNFTTAIPDFGLVTATRLELEYALFGQPQEDMSGYVEDPSFFDPGTDPSPAPSTDPSSDPSSDPSDPSGTVPTVPPGPVEYGYNTLDSIDFEALYNAAGDRDLKAMHQYFGSLTPSRQNEYTGLFRGKNLIFITAESFATACMSPELTPTLWKLSHEGFVFNNYYQPDWTMSTAGGEFANMTGVIPNWVGGKMTIYAVLGNAMPMAMGSMFTGAGYDVNAYHNHWYTFYKRDQLYPVMGYRHFNAINGGTEGGLDWPEDHVGDWPRSDETLMEVTVDDYIDEYLRTGVPFHAYYMTVSAHANWNWSNDMARKNKAAAQAAYPDASATVQAFIACNLELEAGMKLLVEKLEAAGIADDTLIVLTTDHYPYKMLTESADYYNELRGVEDTEKDTSRYKTTLIMWSASIAEPVEVDTPCYSCDVLPTLLNLFGIPYESRLYSGRDVFATNYEPEEYSNCMPLVVFANNKGQGNSWITAAGTYEAATGKFTPNPGVTVSDDYVKKVKNLVAGKIKYARLIISENYYAQVFN